MSVKVKCPKCGAVLSIKKALLEEKGEFVIACPKCANKLRIKGTKEEQPNQEFQEPKTQVFGLLSNNIKYFLVDNDTGQRFELDQLYLTFGRASSNVDTDLKFNTEDHSISRKHCVFRKYSDGVTIEDISKGGTVVNGERMNQFEEKYLYKKTKIEIGKATFRVEIEE